MRDLITPEELEKHLKDGNLSLTPDQFNAINFAMSSNEGLEGPTLKDILAGQESSIADAMGTLGTVTSPIQLEEFTDYITNPSIRRHIGELMEERALSQTAGDLWLGAASAVGQEGLAIIEGFSYLTDFQQHLNVIRGTETEFGNWLGDIMKSWKQELGDAAPVYQEQAAQGFAPTKASWWAANAGSIFSTVSMAAGAGLFTKAGKLAARIMQLNQIGKAIGGTSAGARIYNALSKANTVTAMNGLQMAVNSRYMEATMESAALMDQMLADGKSMEEASQAAAKAFYSNMALLATDVPQYMLMFGGGAKALKGMFSEANKAKSVWATVGNGLFQATTEAGEEFAQYVIGEEAQKQDTYSLGPYSIALSESFSQDFNKYIKDEDAWTSAFFGALGGGVFSIGGPIIRDLTYGKKFKQAQIEDQKKIATLGDGDAADLESHKSFLSLAYRALNRGKTDQLRDSLTQQLNNTEDNDTKERISGYLERLEEMQKNWDIARNNGLNSQLATMYTNNQEELVYRAKDHKKYLQALEETIEGIEDLDPRLREIKKLSLELEILKDEEFQSLGRKQGTGSTSQTVVPRIAEVQSRLNQLVAAAEEEGVISKVNRINDDVDLLHLKTKVATSKDNELQSIKAKELISALRINQIKYELGEYFDFSNSRQAIERRKRLTDKLAQDVKSRKLDYLEHLKEYIGEGVVVTKEVDGQKKFYKLIKTDPSLDEFGAEKFDLQEVAISRTEATQHLDPQYPYNLEEEPQYVSAPVYKETGTIIDLKKNNADILADGYEIFDHLEYVNKVNNQYRNKRIPQLRKELKYVQDEIKTYEEQGFVRGTPKIDPDTGQETGYFEADKGTPSVHLRTLYKRAEEIKESLMQIGMHDSNIASTRMKLMGEYYKTLINEFREAQTQAKQAISEAYKDLNEVNQFITEYKNKLNEYRKKLKGPDTIRGGRIVSKRSIVKYIKETSAKLEEFYQKRDALANRIEKLKERRDSFTSKIQEAEAAYAQAGELRFNDLVRSKDPNQKTAMFTAYSEAKARLKELAGESYDPEARFNEEERLILDSFTTSLRGLSDAITALEQLESELNKAVAEIMRSVSAMFRVADAYKGQTQKLFDPVEQKRLIDKIKDAGMDELIPEVLDLMNTEKDNYDKVKGRLESVQAAIKELKAQQAEALEEFNSISKMLNFVDSQIKPKVQAKANASAKATPDYDTNSVYIPGKPVTDLGTSPDGVKRSIHRMFRGLAGRFTDKNGNLNDSQAQRRYFKFNENNDATKFKLVVVKAEDYPQLLSEEDWANINKNKEKTAETPLIAIIADQEGRPVDVNGQPLSNTHASKTNVASLLSQGVYTMYPSSATSTEFGSKTYETSAEAIKKEQEKFVKARKATVGVITANGFKEFNIKGVSRGKPIYDGVKKPVSELGVDWKDLKVEVFSENKKYGLDMTEEFAPNSERQGLVYAMDSNKNIFQLDPAELSNDDITTVIAVLREVSRRLKAGEVVFMNQSEVVPNSGITFMDFFNSKIYSKIGVDTKSRLSIFTAGGGVPTGNFRILDRNGESHVFDFADVDNKVNEIRSALSGLFHQINASRLEDTTKPFRTVEVLENNQLALTEPYNNYKEYLFTKDKLLTGQQPKSDNMNSVSDYMFANKYIIHEYGDKKTVNPEKKNAPVEITEVPATPENTDIQATGEYSVIHNSLSSILDIKAIFPNINFEGPFEDLGILYTGVIGDDGKFLNDHIVVALRSISDNSKMYGTASFNTVTGQVNEIYLSDSGPFSTENIPQLKGMTTQVMNSILQSVVDNYKNNTDGTFPTQLKISNGETLVFSVKGQQASLPVAAKQYKYIVDSVQSGVGKNFAVDYSKAETGFIPKTTKPKRTNISKRWGNAAGGINRGTPRLARNENYQIEDFEAFDKFMEANLPNVPRQIVRGILANNAWGLVTRAGEVLLSDRAEIGTGYHEAYHVVSLYMMDQKTRLALYKEFRNARKGEQITLSNGQKFTVSKTTPDNLIEEALAEDFRDYMLTGEVKQYKPKQRNFFKKVLDWIKAILGINSSQINEEFAKISKGYYAQHVPTGILESDTKRTITGQNYQFTADAMEGILFFFSNRLLNDPTLLDSFFSKDKKSAVHIDKIMDEIREGLMLDYQSSVEELQLYQRNPMDNAEVIADLTAKLRNLKALLEPETFKSASDYFKDNILKKFNIDVDLVDFIQEDYITELESESYSLEDQIGFESIKIRQSDTASKRIKFLLSSITIDEDTEGTMTLTNDTFGFPKLYPFGTAFAKLANIMTNIYSLEDMNRILEGYAQEDSMFGQISERFNSLAVSTGNDFSSINNTLKFFQAFAKNKNIYGLHLFSPGRNEVFYKEEVPGSISNRMLEQWKLNFRLDEATRLKVKEFKGKKLEELVAFSNSIGLKMNDQYLDMFSDTDRLALRNAIGGVLSQIKQGNEILSLTSEASGYINTIGRLQAKYYPDTSELSVFNLENELVYSNTLNTGLSIMMNKMSSAKSLEEINQELPHTKSLYAQDSKWLKHFSKEGNLIFYSIDQGISKTSSTESSTFEKMGERDLYLSYIQDLIDGRFHLIRPGDNKLERTFEAPLYYKDFSDFNVGFKKDALTYLETELRVAKEVFEGYDSGNVEYWKSNKVIYDSIINEDYGKLGILMDIIFNSPMRESDRTKLKDSFEAVMVDELAVREFIQDNLTLIDQNINQFMNLQVSQLSDKLERNGIIELAEESVLLKGLRLKGLGDTVLKSTLKNTLMIAAGNQLMNSIEQTKLFIGHPAAYGSIDNVFKRLTGLVGTKQVVNVDPSVNAWIDQNLVRQDGKLTGNNRPSLRISIIKDVIASSKFMDFLGDVLGDRASAYEFINEADGGGLITLDEYREFLFRSGMWSNDLERAYQWEIQEGWKGKTVKIPANSRFKDIAGTTVTKEMIEKDGAFMNPLKPQYFGPAYTQDSHLGKMMMLKLALYPLRPSQMENNTILKDINNIAKKQQLGLVVFESGSKTDNPLIKRGLDAAIQDPYNYDIDGTASINTSQELQYAEIPYQFMGIQLEVGFKQKMLASSGTQFAKQVASDIYENGQPLYSDLADKFTNITGLIRSRQEINMEELVEKLGLQKRIVDGQTFFKVASDPDDLKYFQSVLEDELIKRDYPLTLLDGLEYIHMGIDILVSRRKMEQVLLSMADKMVISKKRFGSAKVQHFSTGINTTKGRPYKTVQDVDGSTTIFDSSDLDFYHSTDKNGKTTIHRMEVYLPSYIKELFGDDININDIIDENSPLRNIIGFRVPTQALSSIESIKVKGFLPPSAGDIVVLPTEITVKTGSDFDIDKLFIHYPHYEIIDGKPEYIDYISGTDKNSVEKRFERWWRLKSKKDKAQLAEEVLMDLPRDRGVRKSLQVRAAAMESLKHQSEENKQRYDDILSDFLDYAEVSGNPALDMLFSDLNRDEIGTITDLREYLDGKFDEIKLKIKLTTNPEEYDSVLNLRENLIIYSNFLRDAIDAVRDDNKTLIEKQKELRKRMEISVRDLYYGEFTSWSVDKQNGVEAVENKMMEEYDALIRDPRRVEDLVAPLDAKRLKETAQDLASTLESDIDNYSFAKLADVSNLIDQGRKFLEAKWGIGLGALSATHHILGQQAGLEFNSVKVLDKWGQYNVADLVLPYVAGKQGGISLGAVYDRSGNKITSVLSEFINAFVDALKDPFVFRLQANRESLDVLLMATRMGIPYNITGKFMNTPLVRNYIDISKNRRGISVGNNENTLTVKARKEKTYERVGLSIEEVERIKKTSDYKKMKSGLKFTSVDGRNSWSEYLDRAVRINDLESQTDAVKAFHVILLDNYLLMKKMASFLTQLTLSLNHDTTGPSKESAALLSRENTLAGLLTDNVFTNAHKLTSTDNFLNPYIKSTRDIIEAVAEHTMFVNSKNPQLNKLFSDFLEKTDQLFLRRKAKDKIVSLFKDEFINFVVQTYNNIGNPENVKRIFQGPNSVPKKILKIRRVLEANPATLNEQDTIIYNRYSDNSFIKAFEVYLEQEDPNTNTYLDNAFIPNANTMTPTELNILAEGWKVLYESGDPLAEEIAEMTILQGGLSPSRLNFIETMPTDLYMSYVGKPLEAIKEGYDLYPTVDISAFMNQFLANNWKNGDLVPYNSPVYDVDPFSNQKVNAPFGIYKTVSGKISRPGARDITTYKLVVAATGQPVPTAAMGIENFTGIGVNSKLRAYRRTAEQRTKLLEQVDTPTFDGTPFDDNICKTS